MLDTAPHLLYFPKTEISGVNNINGPFINSAGQPYKPPTGTHESFAEAMNRQHKTDAHCVFYNLYNKETDTCMPSPRINKPALRSIREIGGEVVMIGTAVDIDTPGHVANTIELCEAFDDKLTQAIEEDPRLGKYAAYYTTRGGWRLMYLFDNHVQAEAGEQHIVTLLKAFKDQGFLPDMLADWTRFFRLPSVMRWDKGAPHPTPTWKDKHFYMELNPDARLPLEEIPKSPKGAIIRLRTFKASDKVPTQEECDKKLYANKDGKQVQTAFHKKARKVLAHSPYFPYLFEELPLPCEEKHNWVCAMFGAIIPKLVREAHADAVECFSLIHAPISSWPAEELRTDPYENVWQVCQHIYGNEIDIVNAEAEVKAEEILKSEDALDHMLAGMRTWSPSDRLLDDVPMEVRKEYVKTRLFANVDRFFVPLGAHGRYTDEYLTKEQLIPYIRDSHMAGMVETVKLTNQGEGFVSPVDIINKHSVVLQEVRCLPQIDGGYIDDGSDGRKKALTIPMYRRSTLLEPTYSAEVDGWLRALLGKHYEAAARWIAYALDFEGVAICALSISSPPGTGKKLLITGLSECLERPYIIPSTAIGSKHNECLMRSPFVYVNEAWPVLQNATSPSDRFKEMTAGDDISVEPKFKPVMQVQNPLRILMTANNHDLIYSMTRGRDLTPADKEAIGVRLMHIDVDEGGRTYLEKLGGRHFTERDGARWIRGDSGQPSSFVVARHFLYLYENNRTGRDQRLLVDGNCGGDSAEMFNMASQSDTMPSVMRAVIDLLAGAKGPDWRMFGEHVGVTRYGILRIIRNNLEERVTERGVEACINSMAIGGGEVEVNERQFVQIDIKMVKDYARRWGMDASKALAAVEREKTRK
jgi:hypothetical protein